jgi:hypothetical protein
MFTLGQNNFIKFKLRNLVLKYFNSHTFHIPVMGIGFTIDTPIKVAHLGISSVISLVDDILIEKIREHYCKLHSFPYEAITDNIDDFRAKRITAYLNLVNVIVNDNFERMKISDYCEGSELKKYFDLLPEYSAIKKDFLRLIDSKISKGNLRIWLDKNLVLGSIDVNIMTKLDRITYNKNKEQRPVEYNDGHSAIRGFANSELNSSVVLSAGINPRLYSYFQQFKDFYPDSNNVLKKKIILKISDYRSAIIQGKLLAKKGLWVSEYRLESGLNCGGHAFATDGFLLGPILEEIKNNKESLIEITHALLVQALKDKNLHYPEAPLSMKITAQGGVGTSEEHDFLLEQFNLDSVGWGTPFLLVPEVTNVDEHTLQLLSEAKEKDLYLSNISPLGIPFNSLRNNTKDIEKDAFTVKGRPGSSCPEKYCSSNKEFTNEAICTASRQYQDLKIKELNAQDIDIFSHKIIFDKIVEKACLCVGLSTSAMIVNNLNTKKYGQGVSICPGPNMAYFSEIVSLKKMIDHIYGKINIMMRKDRPNLFIKELGLYIDYFRNLSHSFSIHSTDIQKKQLMSFRDNVNEGINYYKDLFENLKTSFQDMRENILQELELFEIEFNNIDIEHIFCKAV